MLLKAGTLMLTQHLLQTSLPAMLQHRTTAGLREHEAASGVSVDAGAVKEAAVGGRGPGTGPSVMPHHSFLSRYHSMPCIKVPSAS